MSRRKTAIRTARIVGGDLSTAFITRRKFFHRASRNRQKALKGPRRLRLVRRRGRLELWRLGREDMGDNIPDWRGRAGRGTHLPEGVCRRGSRTDLPDRSFRAAPGGNLLEFPPPRSRDRGRWSVPAFLPGSASVDASVLRSGTQPATASLVSATRKEIYRDIERGRSERVYNYFRLSLSQRFRVSSFLQGL